MVMVIGVHAVGYCVPLTPSQYEVFRVLMHTASVPIFFLVDGYLFARRQRQQPRRNDAGAIARSAQRLLVPWLIFTVTYTVARFAFERLGVLDEHLILGQPWTRVLLGAYGSIYAPQLYFLPSLFLLRLAAPAFGRLARIQPLGGLLVAGVVFMAIYKLAIPHVAGVLRIEGGQEPVLHALWGAQYFLLGIVCRRLGELVPAPRVALVALPAWVVAVVLQDRLGEPGGMAMQYLYLVTLLFGFAAASRWLSPIDWIGRHTMGIYLLHAPVVMKVVSLAANAVVSDPAASFLVIIAASLAVSAALVGLINALPHGRRLFGEVSPRPS